MEYLEEPRVLGFVEVLVGRLVMRVDQVLQTVSLELGKSLLAEVNPTFLVLVGLVVRRREFEVLLPRKDFMINGSELLQRNWNSPWANWLGGIVDRTDVFQEQCLWESSDLDWLAIGP